MTTAFDKALRVRVERLLGGDVRLDDLHQIFLELRFRSPDAPAVGEVANFVTHQQERDIGLVTDHAKRLFLFFRYFLSLDDHENEAWKSPLFAEAALANVNLIPELELKTELGLTRKKTRRYCRDALAKFQQAADHTWRPIGKLTLVEHKTLDFLLRNLRVRTAFDEERLASDLRRTLISNGILKPSEVVITNDIKAKLSLFAISKMHGSQLKLDDVTSAQMGIRGGPDGTIEVGAMALMANGRHLNCAMFVSSLQSTEYCIGGLADDPMVADWETLVELTPEMKLQYVGD